MVVRYYGLNDFNLRWIANNNWTYTSKPIEGLYDLIASFLGRFIDIFQIE